LYKNDDKICITKKILLFKEQRKSFFLSKIINRLRFIFSSIIFFQILTTCFYYFLFYLINKNRTQIKQRREK